jgi:hypothetical protein
MKRQLTLAWVIITYHWIWKRENCVPLYIAFGQISVQMVTNGCENKPIFQRIMYELLGDIPTIQVYLDAILITSNGTFEEHAENYRKSTAHFTKGKFQSKFTKMLFWRIQN